MSTASGVTLGTVTSCTGPVVVTDTVHAKLTFKNLTGAMTTAVPGVTPLRVACDATPTRIAVTFALAVAHSVL